jgi:predicted nucleotidyltransferase
VAAQVIEYDWSVTKEKVDEAMRRIIATADPLQIIAFGSRARGDHRTQSDLDLAVILDAPEEKVFALLPYTILAGIDMSIDMVVVSKAKFDLHRPWLNSVYNYIDREGVVLYDREHPGAAHPEALHLGPERRVRLTVPAA